MNSKRESQREDNSEKFCHVNKAVDDGYDALKGLGKYLRNRYGLRWADSTSLVHRAYLRLAEHDQKDCVSLAHARGRMAKAMRSCLIDLIRRDVRYIHVEDGFFFPTRSEDEIFTVHEGLHDLADIEPIQAEIVERRYFGGFSWEEVAEDMDMSVSTAKRHFRSAKNWLRKEL